jgi:hypothetical protein
MDIHKKDIAISISEEIALVNLKWYRGASRYNNGATRYKNKYKLRLILNKAKNIASNSH